MNYFFLAALVQALWGLTPSASRIVLDSLSVDSFVAIRFSISALILGAIVGVGHHWRKIKLRQWIYLFVIGALSYSAASFLTLWGLKNGGVINFAFASSLSPLVVGILAKVVLRENLSRQFFISLPLYSAGILLLAFGKGTLSGFGVAWFSLFLIGAAYFCEAVGFIFSKKLNHIPLPQYLFIAQASGALISWMMVFILGSTPFSESLNFTQWISLGYVSVISCCLLFFAWYWLLNYLPAQKMGFFEAFHVLSAALFGFFIFKEQEPINIWMIFGGSLLLISVYLINRKIGEESKAG